MSKPKTIKEIAALLAVAALFLPALSFGTGLVGEPAANYMLQDTGGQPRQLVESGKVKLLFMVGYS